MEKLEALNPAIWAYFASLDFPGNQVCMLTYADENYRRFLLLV